MFDDPNFGFILAAYLVAIGVIVALSFWIIADHRRQIDLLTKLEKIGARRRSAEKSHERKAAE
jgi:hypothetical protein